VISSKKCSSIESHLAVVSIMCKPAAVEGCLLNPQFVLFPSVLMLLIVLVCIVGFKISITLIVIRSFPVDLKTW
jgi:hypothetical protein